MKLFDVTYEYEPAGKELTLVFAPSEELARTIVTEVYGTSQKIESIVEVSDTETGIYHTSYHCC